MRWTPGIESSNIEDRRGESGGGGGGGGFGGLHIGIGGTIIVLVLSLLFHRNLFTLFDASWSSASAPAGDVSVTHGTSAQRSAWFKRGLDSGDPKACDTFSSNAA